MATPSPVIGFATSNPHKLRETTDCFAVLSPAIRVVAVVPSEEVEETGKTFEENALIKLQACLQQPFPPEVTHIIAEDAGLVVNALNGCYGHSPFPGIHSARWFDATVQHALFGHTFDNPGYTEINRAILRLLSDEPDRSASYVACVALWNRRTDQTHLFTGTVPLQVADAPQGEGGFGYDPIMIPVAYDASRTMAQLKSEEKNRISHRFQALSAVLKAVLAGTEAASSNGCS